MRCNDIDRQIIPRATRMIPWAHAKTFDAVFQTTNDEVQGDDGIFTSIHDGEGQIARYLVGVSSRADFPVDVLAHEVFRFVKKTECLTDDEYATLAANADEWIDRYAIPVRYPQGDQASWIEEACADAFAAYYGSRSYLGTGSGNRSGLSGLAEVHAESLSANGSEPVPLAREASLPEGRMEVAAIFEKIASGEVSAEIQFHPLSPVP
jgi:hypothetical protein